jgi:hypothetical protein
MHWKETAVTGSSTDNGTLMSEEKARTYIVELFRIVSSSSILIIDSIGTLQRVNCPFMVVALLDIPPDITEGRPYFVNAVKMTLDLKDIFIIQDKGYYICGFIILLE